MDPPRLPFRPYVSKAEKQNIPQIPAPPNVPYSKEAHIQQLFITQQYMLHYDEKNYHSRAPRRTRRYMEISTTPLWNIKWCNKYSHLLAVTCNNYLHLYDVLNPYGCTKAAHSIEENDMMKCCAWSNTSRQLVTATINGSVKLHDFIHAGKVACRVQIKCQPTSVMYWKEDNNVIVVAGRTSYLSAFDLRSCQEIMKYDLRGAGDVLSIDKFPDGNTFVASYNEVNRANAQHNLVIWDVRAGAKTSDQIFHERHSCPSVRVHPSGKSFIAQTTGNYAARFQLHGSSFKMDKYVRYNQHTVYEFGTHIDISPDGKHVMSGSSDGHVKTYKFTDGSLLADIKLDHDTAVLDVQYHPIIPRHCAITSWYGGITLME